MSDKNWKIQQQLLEAWAAPLIIEETENVSVEMDEVKTEGTTVKTTIDEWNDNSDKKKNSKKKKNNEDIEKKCIDSKYNYIVLSKWQVYSFLRNWFISSWVECWNSDPIKNEKYISNKWLFENVKDYE